jgi:hypothetical protein
MTDVSSPPAPHGTRPRRTLRLAAAAAGVFGVLGTAGCGIQSSSMKVVGAAPTLQVANDVTSAGTGTGGNQYTLYFFHGDKLTPVTRNTAETVTQEVLLAALIKGPTSTETSAGYSSDIPGDLSVLSFTARDQQWNYSYSEPIGMAERAEIICTVETNLPNVTSVGTDNDGQETWNSCNDFADDYGAPAALLPNLSSSATASADESGDDSGEQ